VVELAFVLARRQNHFFVELVEALRDELNLLGYPSSVCWDGFPEPRSGVVSLLVPPHEYVYLRGEDSLPPPEVLARTIFVCAEQPGTTFFGRNAALVPRAGAAFDINVGSARALAGLGVRHLPLGWTPRWDQGPFSPGEQRELDVLFLGCATPRRLTALASYAPALWRHRCEYRISDNSRPNPAASPSFVVGEDKRRLLRGAEVLINIHQDERPYFEWLRMVEAMLAGAVVVTEHSVDFEPLVPGRHFLSGRVETLGLLARELLEDSERRERMRGEALDLLRERVPLSRAAARLGETAAWLDASAPGPVHVDPARLTFRGREREFPRFGTRPTDPADESVAHRRVLKQTALELLDLRRQVARLGSVLALDERPGTSIVHASPSYRASTPRVSVLVSLFNYAAHIEEALASAAASSYGPSEIVVVDDASRDDGLERARRWAEDHPQQPTLIVAHRLNRGLPEARNTAVDLARGTYVFILDADNALYPYGLERLARALDDDPAAAFAYGLIEQFDAGGSLGLVNVGPWEPDRLRVANWIDAMAMVRRSALRAVGGYTTDPRLHGWEDYDLWCTLAERGEHGVYVPEVVARYRISPGGMLASLTNLSYADAFAALTQRHPRVMGGGLPALV